MTHPFTDFLLFHKTDPKLHFSTPLLFTSISRHKYLQELIPRYHAERWFQFSTQSCLHTPIPRDNKKYFRQSLTFLTCCTQTVNQSMPSCSRPKAKEGIQKKKKKCIHCVRQLQWLFFSLLFRILLSLSIFFFLQHWFLQTFVSEIHTFHKLSHFFFFYKIQRPNLRDYLANHL